MKKHLLLAVALATTFGCAGSDTSSGTGTSTPPPVMDPLIQEGDIVWLDDPTLYVLNKTNGLSVIGLADRSAPLLIGRVALQGTPVELYLKDGYILAINSDVYNSSTNTGSRLTVIDVRKPEAPSSVSYVGLSGSTTTSRLVKDVLYTASDSGQVIESTNVADPRSARLVDRLSLPLGSYGSHVLATEKVFYVASESYGGTAIGECASSYNDREGCTTVFAVDISAASGTLRLGANYAMVGLLKDRWGMDAYDGVLRMLIARGGWWNTGGSMTAALRTFRSPDASQLDPLATLSLETAHLEKVMAARFDGPRGYLVTFRQTDPLFTIDISNPANPVVAGYLQTPGWLDFIIPRGNRLLGIGRDQDAQSSVWRLQASLYDVSLLGSPRLMDRIIFGDGYSSLPDQADNLAKVVRLVDSLGLLLVPYNSTSAGYSGNGAGGQLEIISYAGDKLSTYGRVNSTSPIVRAVPLPPNHIATVTEPMVGIIQLTPQLMVSGWVDLNQPVPGAPPASPDGGSRDGAPPASLDGGSRDGAPPASLDGGSRDGAPPASLDGGSRDGAPPASLDGGSRDGAPPASLDGGSRD
jgi:hypothetical protein